MQRRIGLVFELRGSLPAEPGLPPDADLEYEPEETIAALESALRAIGCEPVRLGGPRDLLRAGAREALPPVDAVLNIAEGAAVPGKVGKNHYRHALRSTAECNAAARLLEIARVRQAPEGRRLTERLRAMLAGLAR